MIDVGTLKQKIWEEVPSVMLYKNEINAILDMKEEIGNNNDNVCVDREETINLVKEFLSELTPNYLEFFKTIDLFIKDDDELCDAIIVQDKLDGRAFNLFFFGSSAKFNRDSKKGLIDLHITNSIRDAFLLTHEFIHLVSGYNDESRLLDEVQSILGEFAFGEFLIRKYCSKELVDKYWNMRVDDFIPRNEDFYTIMKALNDDSIEKITLKHDDMDYAIGLLKDNVKYLVGYYNAYKLANSTDNINDLLVKLNYIKLRYEDLKYIECANDRIAGNDIKVKSKRIG